jgi:hypothetical protein
MMPEERAKDSKPGLKNKLMKDGRIPGVQPLVCNITEAAESGALFFLAVELELLLEEYFQKNGLPPTPVDLEIMIAQAARTMAGE